MTGEGFGPRPQDLITPLRVRERHDAHRAHSEQVHRSILGGPAFEDAPGASTYIRQLRDGLPQSCMHDQGIEVAG